MMGSGVVVGVDGGGTSTDVAVADLAGELLAVERTGGSNHESIGVAGSTAVLEAAVDAALNAAGAARADVRAAVFGLAGVDWPSDEERFQASLDRLGLGGQRRIVNDSLVALRAGCREPWGIVSGVGTGSVTAGVGREGQWFRTMAVGWGEPRGAGSLATEALHAVAAEHHGTGPPTELTDRLVGALGHADVLGLFEAISRGGSPGLRRLAPIVTGLADAGDAVAVSIVVDLARQHADLVAAVADRVHLADDQFDLVTAGAVHTAGGLFSDAFAECIGESCPTATIVALTTPPVIGGVLLALDALGLDASGVAGSAMAAFQHDGAGTDGSRVGDAGPAPRGTVP